MIISVSFLKVCSSCGKHGHIVFPDGTTSEEFGSKGRLYQEVDILVESKKIIDAEAKHLRQSISTSSIPSGSEFPANFQESLSRFVDEIAEGLRTHTSGISASNSARKTIH